MSRSRLVALGAVTAILLVVVAVVRDDGAADHPYDLRGTGPEGLGALGAVLEEVGVQVGQGSRPPGAGVTHAFVPRDLLREADRTDLLRWVEEGGTLVIGDPRSPLHGLEPTGPGPWGSATKEGTPGCGVAALADVAQVELWRWPALRDTEARSPSDPSVVARCFPVADDAAWLTVLVHGDGHLVALASMDPLLNRAIGEADHVVLGAALLGPRPGDHLHVVLPPPPGEGDRTVLDLVPDRVWSSALLALAALLCLVLWRARRLGPPVAERLPAVLPGAELARSIGDLLHRAEGRDAAAARLRRDARQRLVQGLGVPATTPAAHLVDVAVHRLGLPPALVATATLDTPVRDDAALIGVARATARLRDACTHPAATGGLDPAASVHPDAPAAAAIGTPEEPHP